MDEHTYPGAVAPDEDPPLPGTVDLGVAARPCPVCAAEHVHALLVRDRSIDGSPVTRSMAGCCTCREMWWNDPYAVDRVRPTRQRIAGA